MLNTSWYSSATLNEDWYSTQQLADLVKLVNHVSNLTGEIVEIGCWEGKSTIAIANACYPENLICNDTWLGNVEESKLTGEKHVTEIILQKRDVYQTFLRNMNLSTQQNYNVVKEDCIAWLKTFDEPIKFIHIDASHEYESVFETIRLVLPKMVRGGIICGDDFLTSNASRLDLHGGVERAVRELIPNVRNSGNLWYYVIE